MYIHIYIYNIYYILNEGIIGTEGFIAKYRYFVMTKLSMSFSFQQSFQSEIVRDGYESARPVTRIKSHIPVEIKKVNGHLQSLLNS